MTHVVEFFNQGGIIAYPTEAVFGLGCDPDNKEAVEKLLKLKNRPMSKGLILLAANYSQLLPYIDDNKIPQDKRSSILSRWPNGITQLLPINVNLPHYLHGQFDTIAVRVTSQSDVVALCNETNKPIVSTSANFSGGIPAKTWQEAEKTFGQKVDYIIKGKTLGFSQPSIILDGLTGEVLRS